MNEKLTIDNTNRLALGIMEKEKCDYAKAIQKLHCLKLNLICGENIRSSLPFQAALLTAINCGNRAFLGGVNVILPNDNNIPCFLPWYKKATFNEAVLELGATIVNFIDKDAFSLSFGLPAENNEYSLEILCNSWQGGITNSEHKINLECNDYLPLGGILAGSLGVGYAFLKSCGISITVGDKPIGLSLWRPELEWYSKESVGVTVKLLPEKFWMLGLGHLGQAYLWSIALLPFNNTSSVTFFLQDTDRLVNANWSAGLLCENEKNINQYKTRVCSDWLEKRGYKTRIIEKKFDGNTKRSDDDEEPFIALCGFDSAESRTFLEDTGFDLIIEAAVGGTLSTFDCISLHTFPDSEKTPKTIWGGKEGVGEETLLVVLEMFKDMTNEQCGIFAETVANKAISSSFVGAFTSALAIAELIRASNGGKRNDKIVAQLRNLEYKTIIAHKNNLYRTELSKNGFVDVKTL